MVEIGKRYKFLNLRNLKSEVRGKFFKVLDNNHIEIYGDDGSIMINGMGNPYYTYSLSGLIKSIDFTYAQIEPVKHIKKFSLC